MSNSSRPAPTNVNLSKVNSDVSKKLAPKTGSDTIEVWADYGTYDYTTSANINVEKTNFLENK